MIKVIMIEDDAELASMLTQYLEKFDIKVENFEEPFLALGSLNIKKYDILILDLTLPGMDGLDVCKEVVSKFDIPIIISSARSDIVDKVTALKLGADDYLPKPYDPRELEVRIKTILRRYSKINKDKSCEMDRVFVLDEQKKEIKKDGVVLDLTAAEYSILSILIKKRGYVLSREDLLEIDRKGGAIFGGSLAVLINRIRKKIEDDPKKPKYLQTIRGMGYKFSDEDK